MDNGKWIMDNVSKLSIINYPLSIINYPLLQSFRKSKIFKLGYFALSKVKIEALYF